MILPLAIDLALGIEDVAIGIVVLFIAAVTAVGLVGLFR